MFRDDYRLPRYVLPKTAEVTEPKVDWEKICQERRVAARVKELARSMVGYGD